MSKRVLSFFGAATDPLNLAVFRVAVFAWLLRLIARTDYLRFVHTPARLRVPPAGYESFFHWIPMEDTWVTVARDVALLASASALAGFMTRTSAGIACLCATYLLGLPELFGKIDHLHHHLIWFTAILAVARCGDALSIDALRAAWRRAERGDTAPPPAAVAYALPLRFVWLLIGVIYFFPGFWKLHAGPEWFLSDNIKFMMYQFWSEKGFLPLVRIDRYPLLYRAAGLGAIVFETSFIACLFFPRLRLLAVTAGVLFHAMTAVYLRILFLSLLLCYAAFIDWSWVGIHIGRALYPTKLSLVYDGRRILWRQIVASLRSLDVLQGIRYLDASADGITGPPPDSVGGIVTTTGKRVMTGLHAWVAVIARVPLIVPAIPLVFAMALGRYAQSAPAPRRRPDHTVPIDARPQLVGVTIVGGLLLAINIYCGVRQTISWPFSVYPQFSGIHRSATRTTLEAMVRSSRGQMRPVDIALHPQALERLLRGDSATRSEHLRALHDLLTDSQLTLQPGESLQFYEVQRSTLPEDRTQPPLRRELLGEFQADDAAPTPLQ